ncbi:hypothetical protein VT84_28460 [Gemmata sp. SH-PL17]|uniref:hypothetical protein n=1 Tax=Gemmata sp. SH-PL17 TaxID=1630693 RepID=UPI00078EE7CE|nr:hypothetical protein [Gemmata sp. SH-PL17]AMV28370.1 hypothetical protein VT84_28460 [Gemmata sp. SH-PL17]
MSNVLVTYTNDTKKTESYRQLTSWLRESTCHEHHALAERLDEDHIEFPCAASSDSAAIQRGLAEGPEQFAGVVAFTNEDAQRGYALAYRRGEPEPRRIPLTVPHAKLNAEREHPLSRPQVFSNALKVATDFAAESGSSIVLVVKSHGDQNLALTGLMAELLEARSSEELLWALDACQPNAPVVAEQRALGRNHMGRAFLGQRFLGHALLGRYFLGHHNLGRYFLGRHHMGFNGLGFNILGKNQLGKSLLGHRHLGHNILGRILLGHELGRALLLGRYRNGVGTSKWEFATRLKAACKRGRIEIVAIEACDARLPDPIVRHLPSTLRVLTLTEPQSYTNVNYPAVFDRMRNGNQSLPDALTGVLLENGLFQRQR